MDLKIFTDNIEEKAKKQIETLLKQPAFADCKVRIMPDVHAGAGCVIGFTADLGDKVIPNIVGVDIGCGMLAVPLGPTEIDFKKLDEVIRKYVPSGMNVHDKPRLEIAIFQFDQLVCYESLKNVDWLERSLGTLGGGNHFIEIDQDDDGNKYLVIHTGSRNLGKQVADIYQEKAISRMCGKEKYKEMQDKLVRYYKEIGMEKEITKALKLLKKLYSPNISVPKELCYLENEERQFYLNDMRFCQRFAEWNRTIVARIICEQMGWNEEPDGRFETIHNYIDHTSNIVRKGAISAQKGELLLIPINMRDGCILGRGKGNEDWNCSAPHGAGRIMSRAQARSSVSLEEYKKSMNGIYTTSVDESTIDESPMAYKPMEEILKNIEPTVEVLKIIKSVYNFKASE